MNQAPTIIAVAVTYNIGRDFIAYAESALSQVTHMIIVDNGSDDLTPLHHLQQRHTHLTLLYNDDNLGLSKAQNIGITHAFTHHTPDYILLLDDDSELAPTMIEQMLTGLQANPNAENIGLITPQIIDRHADRSYPCLLETSRVSFERRDISVPPFSDEPYIEGLFVALASGSLIKREVFETIGLMNEQFFIDFIDWDFALRLQKSGYNILCTPAALMYHSIGKRSQKTFAGRSFSTTNHSPQRRYSMAKNRIIFWKQHCLTRPAIMAYSAMSLINDCLSILLCEPHKFSKIGLTFKGIFAGLIDFSRSEIPVLGHRPSPPTRTTTSDKTLK